MLENSVSITPHEKQYDGDCENCGQVFETLGRPQKDEDGSPYYAHRTQKCASCLTDLCGECQANGKAHRCENCNRLTCAKCSRQLEGEWHCKDCYRPALELAYAEKCEDLAAEKRRVKEYAGLMERIAKLPLGTHILVAQVIADQAKHAVEFAAKQAA